MSQYDGGRNSTMKTPAALFLLLIQTLRCSASDDSPFQLTNNATGFCLVKTQNICHEIRWTTGDRLLVHQRNKCLGVQGKSVGSEISLYDCDENSDLQRWECRDDNVLALKDQELYIELTADNTAALSKTVGPNNQLTITGTPSGACTKTYREFFTIGGNAAGAPCMFPFRYKDQWYSDCTMIEKSHYWCGVETTYQNELWGFCPTTSHSTDWNVHPITGASYQLNTVSALTWHQAAASCKQQGASLLSITDPHEQAYIIALLGTGGNKIWIGLILEPEHGWKWSDGRPYRYINWDSGHPIPASRHNCAIADPEVRYSWRSSPCSKKLGHICYIKAAEKLPIPAVQTGFCSRPWIPYNGHCFYLNRSQRKTWSDAQRECRNGGGDLVSIHNVEEQSFVISQLGYESTDELWIGLNGLKSKSLFEWSDHSSVSFTSWDFGSPAVSTHLKNCVFIRGEKGNWADSECENKHGYICMKLSSTEATGDQVEQDEGCKTGWRRHGSYCYFIATQTRTFNEAMDNCKRSNSYLADVSNAVDNAFLVSLVGLRPEKHFWLGLSNQKSISKFVWTNKKSVTFTHWNAEMPGNQKGCVAMATGIFAGLWDLLPCTNTEKYICKHSAEGAVVTPRPTIPTTSSPCPPSWTTMTTRNICFKIFQGPRRSWFGARDYCQAIGGDLLSIHSEADLKLMRGSGTVWIGLSAPNPDAGYVWSDGSPLQFQDWTIGEPDNRKKVESCVILDIWRLYSRGSWSDKHCELDFGWVCQIQKGVTPNPTPDPALTGQTELTVSQVAPEDTSSSNYNHAPNKTKDHWLIWNGNQYQFIFMRKTMEEARLYCKSQKGDLASINSEAEAIFLWKMIYGGPEPCWIGLNVDLDGTSEWVDGSPPVFLRWDDNEPRFLSFDEHCAVMTVSLGFWRSSSCGYEYSAICERSGSTAPYVTKPPPVIPKGGCPQNWKKIESKCFISVTNERKTWDEARAKCKAMGGNLASIDTKLVQTFLTFTMAGENSTNLWIGLLNKMGERFYWTDGKPLRHHRLAIRHDISGRREHRQCVMMRKEATSYAGEWTSTSCQDTNGYVCLRSVGVHKQVQGHKKIAREDTVGSIAHTFRDGNSGYTTWTDPSFPDSPVLTTTDYVKVLNDSVKVNPKNMTWYAARQHCESEGASLANLRNVWTQVYVKLMALNLGAPVWIGLNTKETGGYFRYLEGWPVVLTNWDYGEPGREPCVYINLEGKWKTADCEANMASICMKTKDVPPTESPDFPGICPDYATHSFHSNYMGESRLNQKPYWRPFKGNCYLFVVRRLRWADAAVDCALNGGALVSIENPSEQDFIHNNINTYKDMSSSFWIGLYKTHRGQWLWIDKSPMDYTNWNTGEYFGESHAVIIAVDGKWRTQGSSYIRGYICKTPKELLQEPTTTDGLNLTPQSSGNKILQVVLAICVTALVIVVIIVLLKKSGYHFRIPRNSSAFQNPLFSNHELSHPDLSEANNVEADVGEEEHEPVVHL